MTTEHDVLNWLKYNHLDIYQRILSKSRSGCYHRSLADSQLIVPTFIIVTANLVNMHSGFNGRVALLA